MPLNYPKLSTEAPLGSERVSLLPLTFGLYINFLYPVNSHDIAKISKFPNNIPFHLIKICCIPLIPPTPKYPTSINFFS